MSRTVDLVVVGGGEEARRVAADAVRQGLRVLVVLPSGDQRDASRLRRSLARQKRCQKRHRESFCGSRKKTPGVVSAGGVVPAGRQVAVMTHAEVACVDGVRGVEAVVIRDRRTGRLKAVNAGAVWPS